LGIAKLGADVVRGSKAEDWQRLLVCSDSVDRRNDRFIEAHIFGGFNIDAVESMETVPGVKASDSATIDIEIALELFNKKKGIGV